MGQPIRNRRRTAVVVMIVMAVLIIVSVGVPMYNKSRLQSKEAILKQNLFTLRTVIREYTHDKGKAPQTLDELAATGYLRGVPLDPIAGTERGWKIVMKDASNQAEPGIVDVRSSSNKVSLKGTPYSEW